MGDLVNLIQNVLNSIYLKRKRISSVVIILVLIPMFQNCGGSYTSRGLSSTGLDSTSSGGDGPGPVVTPPAGTVLPLPELQKLCKQTTTTPSINSVGLSEITIGSGLGSNKTGDVPSASVQIIANRGITDLTTFNQYGCDSQYSLNLKCEVVTDDASHPAAISTAVDMAGNNLVVAGSTAANLAKAAITTNSCNVGFPAGKDTVNFVISPNSKNNERCVQGSFWVKLSIQNQVTGMGGANPSPVVKYVKVNMNNGCWGESRLKDGGGNLPAVINFGTAVSMDAGWAAVLAPTDDAGATVDVGSVFMYKFDGSQWVQKQKIMIGDAMARESLNSVALLGDTLILGSPYRNKVGAAFFFRRSNDTWNLIQKIDAQDQSQQYQDFGSAVALNANYVFVSSPAYSSSGLGKSGSVSVYSYNSSGMSYVKTLYGATANGAFGSALASNGSTLAVGAPQAIGKETSAEGSVLLFNEAGGSWTNIAAATKKGTALAEKFGASVAILGSKLLVGSPNFSSATKTSLGKATYYSDFNVDAATKTWTGPDASGNAGQGLALSSTGLYIAYPYSNGRAGYVDHYLYSALDTVYFHLIAYNEIANSAFGWSVSASGSDVVIGARIKNDPNDNSGAAYIYRYK